VNWIAPDVERSENYPARRNEPERNMLRDWLDWHRATLLRKCAGLDARRLARRAVPPSNLSLLGLVRHMSERGWVRQTFRGEQIPDLYYRSDAPDADFEEADLSSGAPAACGASASEIAHYRGNAVCAVSFDLGHEGKVIRGYGQGCGRR
jgi:hypothetical protein